MKRAFQHFLKYRTLMNELVRRDLKVKYRRSFLGYLWSLLNPLMMMTVMTIVFSYMFKSNIEYFPMYLICGNTLYNFFSESTGLAMYSIIDNGSLIRKVYIPKFIFPLSRVVSSFVTMSFSLLAIVIVMLVTRVPLHWTVILFWIPLVFMFLFSLGVGMILGSLSVFFRDITHLWGVIMLAWMYLTPLFYPVDESFLPAGVITFMNFNPLYHIITFFRQVVIYGVLPGSVTWTGCTVSCVIAVAAGLFIFNKMQKNFILHL